MPHPRVPSPCIKVCMLDPLTNRCIGCGRTIEEIATWGLEPTNEADSEAPVGPVVSGT